MATKKRLIPEQLRKELIAPNQALFDEYLAAKKDPSNYYPNVREFLEFCAHNNDKKISELDKTDVDLYLKTLTGFKPRPSSSTINFRLSSLSGFRKFLISEYPDDFKENFLSTFPNREPIEENPTEIKALDLVQLSFVRKYNLRSSKDEYIFELFFQLGIAKNDLIACKFPETTNTQLDTLIKKVPKGEITESTINWYFKKITTHLKSKGVYDKNRRNINSYDLVESHNAYFLQCPNCHNSFENTSKYWVLIKVKFDDSDYLDEYRIVCAQCKGVPK
jgi:hypothetical protein